MTQRQSSVRCTARRPHNHRPGRVKLLSCLDHLYLFRVSPDGRLLLNRFVLDGITNELVPKLEVRFHRSEQKLEPEGGVSGSGAVVLDTLAFRDTTQRPFFEPAKELTFLGQFDLDRAWFSVELLPTSEHDKHRWNFFVFTDGQLRLFSVAASTEGLVDPVDQRRVEQDPDKVDQKVTTTIAGISERIIELPGPVVEGFDSAMYHNQVSRVTKSGPQLLKESTRVMLAVPVRSPSTGATELAAVSYKVNSRGMLSEIDRSGKSTLLVGRAKEVLLPATDLDEIKLVADRTPPPTGDIAQLGESISGTLTVGPSESTNGAGTVRAGQEVRLWGTESYDGAYVARSVDSETGTFEVEVPASNGAVNGEQPTQGHWQVVEDDRSGLAFENMIASYAPTADGRLRITCVSHNLSEGDEIKIDGTKSHDGIFPITDVDDDNSFHHRPGVAGRRGRQPQHQAASRLGLRR